jgi:hypothetical protein
VKALADRKEPRGQFHRTALGGVTCLKQANYTCRGENGGSGLVVTDLGRPRPPYDSARLSDAVLSSPGIHGLSSLVEQAERRSLDLSLSLVAGSGRLAWRSGNWHAAEDEPLSGFSAAITIPV